MILVYKLSHYIQHKGWVEEEKRDILRYALELICSNILIFISIALSSIILFHPLKGIIFTLFFFGIRRYIRGSHSQKYYKCFLITNGLFILSSLMAQRLIIGNLIFYTGILVSIYSCLFIVILIESLAGDRELEKRICYAFVFNIVGLIVIYHIDVSYATLAVYTSIIVLLMKVYDYKKKEEELRK